MSLWVRWGLRAGLALPALFLLCIVAAAVPPQRFAYVIGSNDGSVTRVDLDSGTVVSNLMSVGTIANRIEVDATLAWAAAVNSGSDDVTIIDLLTETVTGTLPLPAGSNPWACEFVNGRVFVSGLLSDEVYALDPLGGDPPVTIPVGKAPEGMAVANGKLYVANTGFDFGTFGYDPGTVSVIDLATHTVTTTIPVSLNPQECLVAPDGSVHVVCTGDYYLTQGSVDVIDPATDTIIHSFAVSGFPGGGNVRNGRVFLNVTTTSFSSEIHGYDAGNYAWIWDGTNALLPSFDFYGNIRTKEDGSLVVCNFTNDLLLVESPDAPGSPVAYLVGDGPIDVAIVEREDPVPLIVSGLAATSLPGAVRLTWTSTPEAGVFAFEVDRGNSVGAWRRLARNLTPGRNNSWTDREAPEAGTIFYRVGAADGDGSIVWSAPVVVVREARGDGRLAVRRIVPNPSRGITRLEMFAPHPGVGQLELFDVRGARVASMDVEFAGGEQTIRWDGRDRASRLLAPGMYFARLTLDGERATARLLRVR